MLLLKTEFYSNCKEYDEVTGPVESRPQKKPLNSKLYAVSAETAHNTYKRRPRIQRKRTQQLQVKLGNKPKRLIREIRKKEQGKFEKAVRRIRISSSFT